MKKSYRIISAFIAIIMVVFFCTSCRSMIMGVLENKNDEEKAEILSKRSDSYYSKGVHEKATITIDLAGTLSGAEVSQTGTVNTESTYKNYNSSSFSCLTTQSVYLKTKSGDSTEVVEYTKTDGFVDRKHLIFAYIPQGKSADKETAAYLKSKCSPKEAYTYYAAKASNYSELYQSYNKLFHSVKVTTDDNDKNWIITYSDFNKNKSSYFNQLLGDLATSFSAQPIIEEVTATFTVDIFKSALVHYDVNMSVSFEDRTTYDTDLNVIISISSDISKPSSKKITPQNIDEYEEAGDLRYSYYALSAIHALADSNDCSFDFSSTTKLNAKSSKGGKTQNLIDYTLNGRFNYGKVDNKYLCNVFLTGTGGSNVSMSYDGKKLLLNGTRFSCNSSVVKYQLKSLLSSFIFNEENIIQQSVSTNKDGSSQVNILFRLTPQLKNTFVSLGLGKANIEDSSIKLTVDLDKDMNLTYAEISMSCAKEKYQSYQQIYYTFSHTAKISNVKAADKNELSAVTDH